MVMRLNRLGQFGHYYVSGVDEESYQRFEAAKEAASEQDLDVSSVLSFISKGYFLSDKTIIRQLRKSVPPFFGNDVQCIEFTKPNEVDPSDDAILAFFIRALKNELLDVCSGKREILIPLSGGMDSRIVAGIIAMLRESGELSASVKAITWGTENSRDVVYARRIADILDLSWTHINITPETLTENILITSDNGLEYSPLHLHGKAKLRAVEGVDLIVAASFGDSIGRARYSGRHVSALPVFRSFTDPYSLIRHEVKLDALRRSRLDAAALSLSTDSLPKTYRTEVDYQAHYMHRFINSVWSYVNEVTSVYQAYTSEELWRYMLRLSSSRRSDDLYYKTLVIVNPKLLEVPWSSTGALYGKTSQLPRPIDSHTFYVAPYGRWVREELAERLKDEINSGVLEATNIFNMNSVRNLLVFSNRDNCEEANYLSERILWLVALSKFISRNCIRTSEIGSPSFRDFMFSSFISPGYDIYRRSGLWVKSLIRRIKVHRKWG